MIRNPDDPLSIQIADPIPPLAHVIWWEILPYEGGPGVGDNIYEDRGAALAAAFITDRFDNRFVIIPYEAKP